VGWWQPELPVRAPEGAGFREGRVSASSIGAVVRGCGCRFIWDLVIVDFGRQPSVGGSNVVHAWPEGWERCCMLIWWMAGR
jgi:hypothetical protein